MGVGCAPLPKVVQYASKRVSPHRPLGKMTISATPVYSLCGSSVEAQLAIRADGQAFKRRRTKDVRFGWRWTRWERTDERPIYHQGEGDPASYDDGSNGHGWIPANTTYLGNVRLPKG